jgi:hypothetical protein
MMRTLSALDMKLTITVRPLSSAALNEIAAEMVSAPTEAEAEVLKQKYISGFFGSSVIAPHDRSSTAGPSSTGIRSNARLVSGALNRQRPKKRPTGAHGSSASRKGLHAPRFT